MFCPNEAVRMIVHRAIAGEKCSVTIRKTAEGRYYAMLDGRIELPDPQPEQGEVGITVKVLADMRL